MYILKACVLIFYTCVVIGGLTESFKYKVISNEGVLDLQISSKEIIMTNEGKYNTATVRKPN